MRIALFGPPGAGKGTQAALLVSRYALAHISTGNIIRAAIKEKTDVGVEALEYVSEGRLVPGVLVRKMAEDAIAAQNFADFVLDGYPRTLEQAAWLDEYLDGNDAPLEYVVSLHVPDSTIIERLSRRRVHRETGESYHLDYNPPPPGVPDHLILHRSDDKPEAIQKRLVVYREKTLPLEEYFRAQEKLVEVDAVGSVEEVHQRIRSIIERREVDDRA
jgi:adenylate kinase